MSVHSQVKAQDDGTFKMQRTLLNNVQPDDNIAIKMAAQKQEEHTSRPVSSSSGPPQHQKMTN